MTDLVKAYEEDRDMGTCLLTLWFSELTIEKNTAKNTGVAFLFFDYYPKLRARPCKIHIANLSNQE